MKLDKILFGIVLAMTAVLGLAMLVPEVPDGHGLTHPEFPSMLQGGPGAERHAHILWLGWAFGVLQVFLYTALMAFGVRKDGQLRGIGRPLLACAAVHIAVWSWLVLAYRGYMSEATHSLVFAFPLPTALLLYALWPLTVLFNLCFVIGFKRWVLTDEDFAQYQRLLEAWRPGKAGSGETRRGEETKSAEEG